MRFVIGLLSAALLTPASRGNDADLALRVKVALALACDCGECGDAKTDAPAKVNAGALDWFVSAASKVEDSPAPKVAPKKAKPAAPAAPKAKACPCGVNCPKGGDCGAGCDCGPGGGRLVMESTPYKEVRATVAGGTKVLMMVRPPADRGNRFPVRLDFTTLRCDDAPFDAGLYRCDRSPAGAPQMELEETWVKPMPPPTPVAAPPPIDWQVYVPPVFDPFRECVGTV